MAERPLASKVAVVTGATGLLGVEHCRALARAGARIVATDLDGAAFGRLGEAVEHETDLKPLVVPADVTSKESLERLLDATLTHFGRIDVLICNAAVNEKIEAPGERSGLVRFEDFPLDAWKRAVDVNLTGTFLCCQVLGSELARRRSGSIVTVASTYALVAPDQALYRRSDGTQAFYKSAAYPSTKSAVLGLTRYLAAYWGAMGVRVNALCPGGVQNGQDDHFVTTYSSRTPLGRMAQPDDYAGAVVFLASDASAYMTGATLVVDGGYTAW